MLKNIILAQATICLVTTWFAYSMRVAEQQRVACEAIKPISGIQLYGDYEADPDGGECMPGPEWLHDILGEDFFYRVDRIVLDEPFSDADIERSLPRLRALPGLKEIIIGNHRPGVSDSGIEHLRKALPHVKFLP